MKGNDVIAVVCFTAARIATKKGQDGGGPGRAHHPGVLVKVAGDADSVRTSRVEDTIEIVQIGITISGE